MCHNKELTSRSFRQTTGDASLKNMVCHKTGPASLMRCAESSSIICMEKLHIWSAAAPCKTNINRKAHFVEPHIVTEVRIIIKLIIPSVSGSSPFHITTKDMDDTMLDFLRYRDQIHIVPTSCGTFDLKIEYKSKPNSCSEGRTWRSSP